MLPAVTLEPAGTAIIDVNEALQQQGVSSWATLSGYAEIKYVWPWNPICATIRNLDTVHSLLFNYGLGSAQPVHLPSQLSPPSGPANNAIEGMWWKQEVNVTAFVALSNITAHPLTAMLGVTDAQGANIGQHAVTISPHGTKLVTLTELTSASGREGGVRIAYTGNAEDLIINGGLEDRSSGYSAGLPFSADPKTSTVSTTTIAELGLMNGLADPMLKFPVGTSFTPYTVLRNISTAPLTITPTLWWMQGGTVRRAALSPLSLASSKSQTLDVPSLLLEAGLNNFTGSIDLVFDVQGNSGALLMAGGSVDRSGNYVFAVTPQNVKESFSKSLSYWSIGNGDDTMVTLWNPADEAQDFVFTLFFTGGQYKWPIHLGPKATEMFNISEIVLNQIPDADGNIIPATVREGSGMIAGALADVEQILVSMDASTYNVRKATCGVYCQTCDGFVDFVISPGFSLPIGAQQQLTATGNYDGGQQYNLTADVHSWSSSNTAVATVDQHGLVTVKGAGSATITGVDNSDANYTPNVCEGMPFNCPVQAYSSNSVQGSGQGDPTPTITQINPNVWSAGATTSFTITGTGFGTSPALTISGGGITNYSIASSTNTQISASVTISATTPNESVTVTVTSNGYNGNGFQSGGGTQSPQSSPVSVSVTALPAPAPRIMMGGTDITGTTQSVVVGQQIALTTSASLPGGLARLTNSWTFSGTIIGGYNASTSGGSVIVPTLTGTSATVYWVYSGTGLQVKYSYCMTNSQCSPSATATFNVTGPAGGTMTNTAYPRLTITTISVNCIRLIYGVTTGGTCTSSSGTNGIQFNSPTGYANSSGGTFKLVQLINSDVLTGSRTHTATPGLDTSYPYGTPPDGDSPYVLLQPTYTTVSRSFNATMYLMWQSSTTNSIPVPLGYQQWGFSGSATCHSSCGSIGSWTATTNGTPGPVGSFITSAPSQPFNGYPTWSGLSQ